ncbi:HET-domain-containing protein [Trametes sanguinea]|nr:HET-domain-containing protein [Trametes sanguinea]
MPRFLCTKTGQFVWIANPSEVCYAILSHTWRPREEGGEQSYQDVLKIQATAAEELRGTTVPGRDATPTPLPSILSRPELSDKIKNFCAVARNAGYDLAWADACCIDQSSSAELSEAINSMYEWYRTADVCYAYLADVSDGDKPKLPDSQFRASRWHTRGWTLQELVAPRRVVFLSSSWRVIGTKFGLAVALQEITGVHLPILLNNDTVRRASVAQRMSWAADRETTRVEDIAYCLLGLFGVYMAPIYGEGHNAFRRLQEEIVKNVPDHTIFAWGTHVTLSVDPTSQDILVDPDEDSVERVQSGASLLASSPRAFKNASDIVKALLFDVEDLAGAPRQSFLWSTHCVFTPHGVTLTLPCVSVSRWPRRTSTGTSFDIFKFDGEDDRLAFLQTECRMVRSSVYPYSPLGWSSPTVQ